MPKIKVVGQTVKKLERKQTDRQTDYLPCFAVDKNKIKDDCKMKNGHFLGCKMENTVRTMKSAVKWKMVILTTEKWKMSVFKSVKL